MYELGAEGVWVGSRRNRGREQRVYGLGAEGVCVGSRRNRGWEQKV